MGAVVPAPRKGETVCYMAIAGSTYDAVITAVHSSEVVDLDVALGRGHTLHLSRIKRRHSVSERLVWFRMDD